LDWVQISAAIKESGEGHIAADAARAVQVSYSHAGGLDEVKSDSGGGG
jgi:hypothetical protein